MKILHLDTSTNVFSIALSDGKQVIAEFCGDAGPATSAKIPGHIQSLLKHASLEIHDVDAFAVTVGPGSFTGVRVGIALIKGLAYSTGRPIIALSSLELLALNAQSSALPVCALFDARRGEVYSALYHFDNGMRLIRPEMAITPAQLLDELAGPTLFIGDGALRYHDTIVERFGSKAHFAAAHLQYPKASAGAALAVNLLDAGQTVSPFTIAPRYLRLSEAEINKRRINSCIKTMVE
jgi:tRNA threonylcarbamoyladenosine biosynthesis protein TsaB